MSDKPFDYYAGYPGQQATPKWVGVALGSLFGGMLLVAVGIGVHLFAPARQAQASTTPPPAPAAIAAPVVAPQAQADVPAPTASADAPADEAAPSKSRHHHHASKHAKVAKGSSKVAVAKGAKYSKAQAYGKSVAKRDKKGRDEIDRLLGL